MQSLQVTIGGENTDLSLSEFRLLYHFMRNPNKAFSRNELRTLTKGDENKLDERSIDVYVMRLRKSLQKRGYQDLIQTVRGIGYRFNS
jgi:two-component system phosphate regulon response regulator PhoB